MDAGHRGRADTQPQDGNVEDDLVSNILYGPARRLLGSQLDDDAMIQLAEKEFQGKAFSVVKNWMLLDVLLPATEEKVIEAQGLKPTVLYANNVLFDSTSSALPASGVITGYQQEHVGYLFVAEEARFVLMGAGHRKTVGLPSIIALRNALSGSGNAGHE